MDNSILSGKGGSGKKTKVVKLAPKSKGYKAAPAATKKPKAKKG